MCTFIILSCSLLRSAGSSGISTYLCLISFLETTSNSWVGVREVRFLGVTENFLLSSFVISSLLKTLPHTDFTINWISISSSAVLPWEGGGSSSSCSSFSETNGEVVDAVLLLLSCCLKSEMKMNKPTKIHECMTLVCTLNYIQMTNLLN